MSALSSLVASMSPGTFALLHADGDGGTYTQDLVDAKTSGGDGVDGIWGFQGKIAYDPVHDRIWGAGGAHDGQTELIRYDVATDTFTNYGQITGVTSGRHSYDSNTIDYVLGKLYISLQLTTDQFYALDLATITWSTPTQPSAFPTDEVSQCYFPDRSEMLRLQARTLGKYSQSGDSWSIITSSGLSALGERNSVMRYCPQHNCVLIFGGSDATGTPTTFSRAIYKYDSAGTITRLTTNDLPASVVTYINQSVSAVDPASGELIILNAVLNGNDGTNVNLNDFTGSLEMWKGVLNAAATTITWTSINTSIVPSTANWWLAAGNPGSVVAVPVSTYGVILFASSVIASGKSKVYVYKHQPVIGGYLMPDLQDEKDCYTNMSLTYGSTAPSYAADSGYTFTAVDNHNDPESDDLNTYILQYVRTGQAGYLSRAQKWRDFWVNNLPTTEYNNDIAGFGGEHIFGWGLLTYYEYSLTTGTADTAAYNMAVNIAKDVAHLWGVDTEYSGIRNHGGMAYGARGPARHIMLLVRLIQVAGNVTLSNYNNSGGTVAAQTLLNQMIDTITSGSGNGNDYWNATYGCYFGDSALTSEVGGNYASGDRYQGSFQLGALCDALFRYYMAYRDSTASGDSTRVATVKSRLISMANFVNTYGMDATYDYTSSYFGVNINTGTGLQKYTIPSPVQFWDTTYTASLVNPLVIGYKLTGTAALLTKAKHVYQRHNGAITDDGVSGNFDPNNRNTIINHFVDTVANNALTPNSFTEQYLEYNKGELQYTYLLFENGGSPDVLSTASTTRLAVVLR